MSTKNKKETTSDLLTNIFPNSLKQITALRTRVPITDLINSVSFNVTVAQLQAEDDSAEHSLANILDPGKLGVFWYDPTDTTSTDDGGATVVLTSTNKRYKRIIYRTVDARWFGYDNNYFNQASDALTALQPGIRYVGLELNVKVNGQLNTFWFKSGIADGDLVPKASETNNIEFTIGDGGDKTPVDGVSDYVDSALAGRTILGFWVSGRKVRTVVSPATLPTDNIYGQFLPNVNPNLVTLRIMNGVFTIDNDYSIMYK